jgi:hypothetical protein
MGKGIDILQLGEASAIRGAVLEVDPAPGSVDHPQSFNWAGQATCAEFHTQANHIWMPSQMTSTSLSASSCSAASSSISNYEDFSSSVSNSFGISLGGSYKEYAGAVGYETTSASSIRQGLKENRVAMESACGSELYQLRMVSDAAYSRAFLDKVAALPESDSVSAPYDDFVNTFGTHYVMGATMGGTLKRKVSISTSECWESSVQETTQGVNAEFAADLEVASVGVAGSHDSAQSSAKAKETTKASSSSNWHSLGGDAALLEGDQVCFQVWRASTRPLADAVKLSLSTIDAAVYQAAMANGDSSTVAGKKSEATTKYVRAHLQASLDKMKQEVGTKTVKDPETCSTNSSPHMHTYNYFAWTLLAHLISCFF